MDWLKLLTWVGGVALGVALVATAVLVYNNIASKTVVIAASAFVGAAFIFGINLWAELRGSTVRDRLSVEYVVDRAETSIRTWRYPTHGGQRLLVETDASNWLATSRPAAFDGDRDRLGRDLALFSLIGLLARAEFDWQLRQTIYKGDVSGTWVTSGRVSKPAECRELREGDITRLLADGGNHFAEVPIVIVGGVLCLPAGGEMTITTSSLILRTPICQVRFTAESSGGVSYMVPRSGGRVEALPGGGSRYETRVVGLAVEITRFALRAYHRDAEKEVAWCQRLVESAREWFRPGDPEPPEPLQPWVRPGPIAPDAL